MNTQPTTEAMPDGAWVLSFICCGYDYLAPLWFDSWEEADRTREMFTSGPGARPYGRPDLWGHERAAIITSIGAPS